MAWGIGSREREQVFGADFRMNFLSSYSDTTSSESNVGLSVQVIMSCNKRRRGYLAVKLSADFSPLACETVRENIMELASEVWSLKRGFFVTAIEAIADVNQLFRSFNTAQCACYRPKAVTSQVER